MAIFLGKLNDIDVYSTSTPGLSDVEVFTIYSPDGIKKYVVSEGSTAYKTLIPNLTQRPVQIPKWALEEFKTKYLNASL